MSNVDTIESSDIDRDQDSKSRQRRCIVTNRCLSPSEMVRFVVGPDNMIVPDIDGRLPGRGIWLSADRNTIKTACARNLFARAARQPVVVDDQLVERVESLLVRRCTELLGLARRAGQAVAGYVKVQGWLRGGQAALLLSASDGAADGRDKLRRVARNTPVISVLKAAELGGPFGRDQTVHAAIAPGGLAKKFVETAARLSGFRCIPEYRKSDE